MSAQNPFLRLIFSVLAVVTVCTAYSQGTQRSIIIRGVVKNSNQEPLPGATVGIAALNQFALTDGQGKFELRGIPPGQHQLSVRYLGHQEETRTITTGGHQEIDVSFD